MRIGKAQILNRGSGGKNGRTTTGRMFIKIIYVLKRERLLYMSQRDSKKSHQKFIAHGQRIWPRRVANAIHPFGRLLSQKITNRLGQPTGICPSAFPTMPRCPLTVPFMHIASSLPSIPCLSNRFFQKSHFWTSHTSFMAVNLFVPSAKLSLAPFKIGPQRMEKVNLVTCLSMREGWEWRLETTFFLTPETD